MKHLISRYAFLVIAGLLLTSFYTAFGCGGSSSPLSVNLSPRANNKIFTTDPVSITFSQEMNQESVEAAFTITGSDPVPGTFSWDGNTLTFTRESGLWKTHHQYTITVTTDAKNKAGVSLPEDFIQTFVPEINLHDLNGDGLDDFVVSSAFHTFNGKTNAGTAYIFFGKTEWSDVDLSSATADATFGFEQQDAGIGLDARLVGDINGDGYADMVISIASGPPSVIFIVYGSAEFSSITLTEIDDTVPATFETLNQLGGIALGTSDVTLLGYPITPAGDVNGDGLADFLVTGRYGTAPDENTRHWLVLGRTEAFPPYTTDLTTMPSIDAISNAKYTVFGDRFLIGIHGLPAAACDINGDELDDLVFGSADTEVGGATSAGKVFVVAGSESPLDRDLITEAADQTITAPSTANFFLGGGVACGDVNGDGYGDILAGAPGYNTGIGRAYLIAGGEAFSDVDLASAQPLATYTGLQSTGPMPSMFGTSEAVLGDVNGDGINDYIFSAPVQTVDGADFRGQMYLFLGSESPTASADLGADGTANATYSGPIPPSASSPGNISILGFTKPIGDVNGDGLDDILLGAPGASEGGVLERGIVYLIFGSESPSSLDFASDSPNVKILGADAENKLGIILPFF